MQQQLASLQEIYIIWQSSLGSYRLSPLAKGRIVFRSLFICDRWFILVIFKVSKGQVHEGIIQITHKGSVITWDFDVLRHDVVFTVFRLKNPLKVKSPSSTPTATPTGHTSFIFPPKNSGPPMAGPAAPVPATYIGLNQVGLIFCCHLRVIILAY